MMNICRAVLYIIVISLLRDHLEVKSLKGKSTDARPNEFPFVVFLAPVGKFNTLNLMRSTCTGVFITREHVLALMYCVRDTNGRLGVFGGSTNAYETFAYDVSTWMSFNDWATLHNKPLVDDYQDIAIITISNPEKDRFMRPVNLPSVDDEFYGAKVAVIGMGETDNDKYPFILKTASLTLLSKQQCRKRAPSEMTIEVENEKLLCSDSPPKIIKKDRGGPILWAKNTLVGLNLVFKRRNAWVQFPTLNLHLKIHSYPLYREFICDLAGDEFISTNPETASKNKRSFCDKENRI